jgi:hypothetical protein
MPKKEIENKKLKEWIQNPEKWITLKEEKTFRENVAEIFAPTLAPSERYKRWKELALKLAKDRKSFTDEENKEFAGIVLSINTTNHHRLIMEAMRDERDRTSIAEYAEDLIKEYECKSITERSLCEVVALSYFSIMKTSKTLSQMHSVEYLSQEKNNFYSVLSKELEKQNRMYLTSLQTLRTLKSPFWWMRINAKNAFIGENQQFNHNKDISWENQ